MSTLGNSDNSAPRAHPRETTLVGYAPAPVPVLSSVPLRPSARREEEPAIETAVALEATSSSAAPGHLDRRNPLSRRQAINRGRHLSRRFFEEGERHQRTGWEDAALASDEEDGKTNSSVHFDSFDEVPSRRLTGIALTGIAGAAVLGLAAWGMGWLRSPLPVPPPDTVSRNESVALAATTLPVASPESATPREPGPETRATVGLPPAPRIEEAEAPAATGAPPPSPPRGHVLPSPSRPSRPSRANTPPPSPPRSLGANPIQPSGRGPLPLSRRKVPSIQHPRAGGIPTAQPKHPVPLGKGSVRTSAVGPRVLGQISAPANEGVVPPESPAGPTAPTDRSSAGAQAAAAATAPAPTPAPDESPAAPSSGSTQAGASDDSDTATN